MEHDISTLPDKRVCVQRDQVPNNRVREHRERLRMSRADLAARSGLSVQAIGHIETGYRPLNDRTLAAIASALGMRKALLLREIETSGGDPRQSDIAEDEVERMILRFWRRLPADGKDAAIMMMSRWAEDTVRKVSVG